MTVGEIAGALERDGIAVVRGLLPPRRCADLLAVVRRMQARPGPFHRRLSPEGEPALHSDLFRFRDVPEIADLVRGGPLPDLARAVFGAGAVVLEDQWFASAAGASTPSPWHQDDPYHPLDRPFLTIWLPLTPVPGASALKGVVGSHLGAVYAPVEFSATEATLGGTAGYRLEPVPDVDATRGRSRCSCRTSSRATRSCWTRAPARGGRLLRHRLRPALDPLRASRDPLPAAAWAVASFWDDHEWSAGDLLASARFPMVTG
ncbi:hypothetical protein BJF78_04230 [Pseudonocardia sp. CNS-139]|nr:hypothetical protein BJF78_04230 [Pseudonocardia sp. CNS-139]